jgi:hypothetical protein
MKSWPRIVGVLLLCAASAVSQQTPPAQRLDERLPANTQFYVYWHGSASMQQVRGANSLLRLWDDPEFAPARDALFASLINERKLSPSGAFTRELLISLLENQAIFGFTSFGPPRAAQKAGQPLEPEKMFFIYDAAGKLPLVQAGVQLLPAADGKLPNVTRSSFSSTTIETVTSGKEVTHRTFVGNYFVYSPDRKTIEQVIKQLEAPSANALAQDANYQAARRAIGNGTSLDFFFNLRSLAESLQQSMATQTPTAGDAVAKSMKLDQLRAMAMGLRFDAPATRIRMAVLGNMSQGGIFDLIGASAPDLATPSVVPAGTASYNAFRIDLAGFYRSFRASASSSLPAEQARFFDTLDSGAETALGMPLVDALKLLSGEMATYSLESGVDLESSAFAFAIRKPEDVLHIVRTLFGSSITNESREGDATVLALAMPYRDSKTGAQRKRFYYAAFTEQMMVVAPRKAMLREAITRMGNGSGSANSASLAGDPKFLAVRSRLPKNVSGISYADLTRIQWENEFRAAEDMAGGNGSPSAASASLKEWQRLLNPAVLSRHLRISATGWWKQADGIYLEGFVE